MANGSTTNTTAPSIENEKPSPFVVPPEALGKMPSIPKSWLTPISSQELLGTPTAIKREPIFPIKPITSDELLGLARPAVGTELSQDYSLSENEPWYSKTWHWMWKPLFDFHKLGGTSGWEQGGEDVLNQILTPGNIAVGALIATGLGSVGAGALETLGLSEQASQIVLSGARGLVNAGFTVSQVGALMTQSDEFLDALKAGDVETAKRLAVNATATGAFAVLSGLAAAKDWGVASRESGLVKTSEQLSNAKKILGKHLLLGEEIAGDEAEKISDSLHELLKLPHESWMVRHLVGRTAEEETLRGGILRWIEAGEDTALANFRMKTLIAAAGPEELPVITRYAKKVGFTDSQIKDALAPLHPDAVKDIQAELDKVDLGFAPTLIPILPKIPGVDLSEKALIEKAKQSNFEINEVTSEHPAPKIAWLSPGGGYAINATHSSHDEIARGLTNYYSIPETLRGRIRPEQFLIDNNWVRKENDGNYSVKDLSDSNLDTVERDFAASRKYGKENLVIDYYKEDPRYTGRYISTVLLTPNDYKDISLKEAITHQLRTGNTYILHHEMRGPKLSYSEMATQAAQLHLLNGGSTVNVYSGNLIGQKSYAVAVHPEHNVVLEHAPSAEEISQYIHANPEREALLNRPDRSLGTWKESAGHHELDIVATPRTLTEALQLAREYKQKSVYDLYTRKTIPATVDGAIDALADQSIPPMFQQEAVQRGPLVTWQAKEKLLDNEDYLKQSLNIYEQEVSRPVRQLARLLGIRVRLFPSRSPLGVALSKSWMIEVQHLMEKMAGGKEVTPEQMIDRLAASWARSVTYASPASIKEQLKDVWDSNKPVILLDPLKHREYAERGYQKSFQQIMLHEIGHIFGGLVIPGYIFQKLPFPIREGLQTSSFEQKAGVSILNQPAELGELLAEIFAQMMRNPEEPIQLTAEHVRFLQALTEQSGHPLLEKILKAKSVPEAVKQLGLNAGIDPHWGSLSRYLPEELKKNLSKTVQQKIVDQFLKLPYQDIENLARAGQIAKGWYAETAAILKSIFGHDASLMANLIAAFSPNQEIRQNFINAFNFYGDWVDQGKPTDIKTLSGMVRRSGFKPGDTWYANIIRATRGEPIHGFKVPEFAENMEGNLERLTKDRHVAYGLGKTKKFWQNKIHRLAAEIAFRLTAERMGWKPAEVEETYWATIRSLLKLTRERRISPSEAGRVITDADIEAGKLGDLIVRDPEVRAALDRLARITGDDRFTASNIQSSEGFREARKITESARRGGIEEISRDFLARASERSFRASRTEEPLRQLGLRFQYTPEMVLKSSLYSPSESIVNQLLKDNGTTTDITKAGFVLPDKTLIPLRGEHNSMIDAAVGRVKKLDPTIQSIDRERLINQNKIARVRYQITKAGNQFVFSLPQSGVTPEQLEVIRQAAGLMSRTGQLALEIADKRGPSIVIDFPQIADVNRIVAHLYKQYTPDFAQTLTPATAEHPISLEPPDTSSFKRKYSAREKAKLIPKYMYAVYRMRAEDKDVGRRVRKILEDEFKLANKHGVVRQAVENYITHIWKPDASKWWQPEVAQNEMVNNILHQTHSGVFDTNFPYAKHRVFSSTFEGEIRGYKLKYDDPIALASMYHYRLGKVLAARKFLEELMIQGIKVSNGSPLAAISGRANLAENLGSESSNPTIFVDNNRIRSLRIAKHVVDDLKETGQLDEFLDSGRIFQIGVDKKPVLNEAGKPIIDPKTGQPEVTETPKYAWDVSDYQVLDHPAFREWDWQAEAPDGTSIFNKGDIRIHPEAAEFIRRAVGAERSAIRDFKIGNVEVGNLLLKTSGGAKHLLLSLSPFHLNQEGLRAIMVGINPFKMEKYDVANDEVLQDLISNGLSIRGYRNMDEFTEGVGGHSAIINKIPGLRNLQGILQDFLFNKYIPNLKVRASKSLLERYTRAGSANPYADAAAHTNAVFGGINYRMLGRSVTTQDVMRLGLLAPDWLESEIRTLGRALGFAGKPGFKIMSMDMVRISAELFLAARVLNMITTGNPHFEAPFGVAVQQEDGTEKIHTLRTLPTDLLHAISDPRNFIQGRVNPLTVRTALEAYTGKNQFGRRVTPPTEIEDLIRNVVPISLQAGIMHQLGRIEDVSSPDQVLKASGISVYKYRTEAEKMAQEYGSYYNESGPLEHQELALHQRNLRLEDMLRRGQISQGQILAQLPRITARNIITNAALTPLQSRFKRLPLKYKLQVWQRATPPEKDELHTMLWKSRYAWLRNHRTLQEKQADPITWMLLKAVYPDLQ